MSTIAITGNEHPKLLEAIRAALREEAPKRPPLDPNHSPFGFVQLATTGGGWTCGLCKQPVVDLGIGEWKHR